MAPRKLTARFVETVKTDQPRIEVRDADEEGLELRVTKRGAKTWALRYRRKSDGTKRLLTLGRYPALSLEEARVRAQEERARVSRGVDPAAGVQERKHAPTFQEVVAEWQRDYAEANRTERVRKDDQSVLNLYILPSIGNMKIHSIGRREMNKLLSDAKSAVDGRKGHSKPGHKARRLTHRPNRVFELMRAVLRWAVEQEILSANPMLGMKRPIKKEVPRERALSSAEIQTLWSALDKVRTKQGSWKLLDGALPMSRATTLTMKLSLATGQRIGEVSGMALSELDLNDTAPMWTIPSSRAKNREPHRVPLSPLASQLIREARDLAGSSPWLFPSPSGEGGIDPHAATKALGRARPAIGLNDFRVHDLRRTAATRMAEMGINPHTISLVLNHISVRRGTITGKVYNHYSYDREKREALDAWGARLERIIAGPETADLSPSQ